MLPARPQQVKRGGGSTYRTSCGSFTFVRDVEPLNEARTKPAGCFSILLEVDSCLRGGVAKMLADPDLLLMLAQ
jgi:hypothetical protein